MANPEFSVLIPVYNTPGDLLRRCLNSLVAPLDIDIEIIVVDASTSEEPALVCKSYSEVSYYRSEVAAVARQRNICLSKANGKYLVFVDSDDCVSSMFFSELRRYLVGEPDLFVFGHCASGDYFIPDDSACVYRTSDVSTISRWFSSIGGEGRPQFEHKSVWGKVYKASIVRSNSLCFNEDLCLAEDHFFNLEYIRFCSSVIAVPSLRLYSNQISTNSTTIQWESNRPERFLAIVSAWDSFLAQHPEEAWREREKAYELTLIHIPLMLRFYFCSKAFRAGKIWAKREFVTLLREKPYHQAIRLCRFRYCPNRLKRNELFVLKLGLYGIFFEAYYHKINGRVKP